MPAFRKLRISASRFHDVIVQLPPWGSLPMRPPRKPPLRRACNALRNVYIAKGTKKRRDRRCRRVTDTNATAIWILPKAAAVRMFWRGGLPPDDRAAELVAQARRERPT